MPSQRMTSLFINLLPSPLKGRNQNRLVATLTRRQSPQIEIALSRLGAGGCVSLLDALQVTTEGSAK